MKPALKYANGQHRSRITAVGVRAEQAAPSLRHRVKALLPAAASQPAATTSSPSTDPQRPSPPPAAAAAAAAAAASSSQSVQAALANPNTALTAAAAFSTIAAAVFASSSSPSQLLHFIDASAHAWVATHTTAEWRLAVGERVISDLPIACGVAAWLLLSAACLSASPRRAAAPLALCWMFYFGAAGAGSLGADPWLVHALKELFARVRPSCEIHHTYSFPSGHTAAATFLVGAALVVLLPLAARLGGWGASAGPAGGSASPGNHSSSGSGDMTGTGRLLDRVVFPIWGSAVATTACGRVLADAVRWVWGLGWRRGVLVVAHCCACRHQSSPHRPAPSIAPSQHWVTDTLAGGSLGVACVSTLSIAVSWVLEAAEASSGTASGEATSTTPLQRGGSRQQDV